MILISWVIKLHGRVTGQKQEARILQTTELKPRNGSTLFPWAICSLLGATRAYGRHQSS